MADGQQGMPYYDAFTTTTLQPPLQPYGGVTTTTTAATHHRHHHHHKDEDHHHHNKDHHPHHDEERGWAWGAYLCVVFIFLGVFFFILAAVALGQSNHVKHHVEMRLSQFQETFEEQQTLRDGLSAKTVPIGALGKKHSDATKQRHVALCASQSYYSKKGDALLLNDDRLEVLTQTIDEIRHGDMKDYYYYHIHARLVLSTTTMASPKAQNRVYLVMTYNITSSFGRFSTVRLEELEFNAVDQSIGAMRSIVLCTNNPFMDVQRCDASLTRRNILALGGEESVPLEIALPLTTVTTTTPKETETVHQEGLVDFEEEGDEEKNHKEKQRRQVMGLRLYNLVFYQAEEEIIATPENKTRSHATTGSLDIADSYKEERILTLEPVQCY